MSIDGTHLYEKYKDTLFMGCDGNNQHLLLQKARILIVGDDSWHVLETE